MDFDRKAIIVIGVLAGIHALWKNLMFTEFLGNWGVSFFIYCAVIAVLRVGKEEIQKYKRS